MDPLTHAIVGMAIGMQGGETLSLSNAALVASTLGAVAPDFDIVAKIWGDYTYIKQHRGFSHSIPGLLIIAAVFGGLLTLFYPGHSYWEITRWVLLGALSHSMLDVFNSYGVEILWPLSRKKWTLNLLMIFDPFIFIFFAGLIILSKDSVYTIFIIIVLCLYLTGRYFMRLVAYKKIMMHLQGKYEDVQLAVLPSTFNLFKWDFIAYVPGKRIVGSVNLLKKGFKIVRMLICIKDEMREMLSNTTLGILFKEFTPYYHIDYEVSGDRIIGRFMDLRYMVKDRFLHNGTIVMSKDEKVEKAIFQPFNLSRQIYL